MSQSNTNSFTNCIANAFLSYIDKNILSPEDETESRLNTLKTLLPKIQSHEIINKAITLCLDRNCINTISLLIGEAKPVEINPDESEPVITEKDKSPTIYFKNYVKNGIITADNVNNVIEINGEEDRPLIIACSLGYTDLVKELVQIGANISLKSINIVPGDDALALAVTHNCREILIYLLDQSPTQDSINSAFSAACLDANLDVLDLLYSKNPSAPECALESVIQYGDLVTLEYLVDKFPSILKDYGEIVMRGFILACAEDDCEAMIEYLINKGVDVHYKNELALITAIQNEKLVNLDILLAQGVNIHVDCDKPITEAVKTKNKNIIDAIVNCESNQHFNFVLCLNKAYWK